MPISHQQLLRYQCLSSIFNLLQNKYLLQVRVAKSCNGSDSKPHWNVQGNFTLMISYILYRNRIVPNELQIETLHKIRTASQGIVSYKLRETSSIW